MAHKVDLFNCGDGRAAGPLAAWTLTEHLGRDWPSQVVRQELGDGEAAAAVGLEVVDECGAVSPAQLDRDGSGLWYVADLPARAARQYQLRASARPAASALSWQVADGVFEAATAGLGVRLAWREGPGPLGPPLLGVRGPDGTWFGSSAWAGAALDTGPCEVVEAGPVRLVVRQTYSGPGGQRLACEYTMDCASPVLHVDLCWDPGGAGAAQAQDPSREPALRPRLEWRLGGGFAPSHAYWRPHSPTTERAPTPDDSHRRQVYEIPSGRDHIALGPFFNWEKDAASFWCAWDATGRDLLYLGCPGPSRFHTAAVYQRATVETGNGGVDVILPLQPGRTGLTLALLDRETTAAHSEGAPCDLDRLHCRLNGLGLREYAGMTLEWPGAEGGGFPRLWITAAEVPRVRQRLSRWDWLRERFEVHADDRLLDVHAEPDLRVDPSRPAILGQDPAGAYLASGDESWAQRARLDLVAALDSMVASLLDYGPTVDGNLGISLARPWRALVLNLDLVLDSPAFAPAERADVLRKLAFVAEVSCTDDAWPATGSGVHRGNDNFHPDVVSARGLAAAQLDGHPRQRRWLDEARQEMAAFLERYHLPSGMSRESATYQLCVLAYVLQLDAALARRDGPRLVDEPACRASLDFLASIQTPVDERCGYRMLPTVGHVTVHAWCQSLQAYFGWAARATARTDPAFSARMMAAWQRGGGFILPLHDFLHHRIWSLPLCLLDPDLPSEEPAGFLESRAHEGFGAVLRARHGDRGEGYVLLKMGECTGHFDNDEGSLIWYAFGQPLLADFGCQYNPNFHAHPWLHNRISIDHCADGPPRAGRLLGLQCEPGLDYACGQVRVESLYRETEWPVRESSFDFRQVAEEPRAIEPHSWSRHLIYLHELEALVLYDEVAGTLPTDWNLQVYADRIRVERDPIEGARIHFAGSMGVDLTVLLAEPREPRLEMSAFSHLGFDEPRLPHWWWRGAAWTAPPGTQMTSMAEQALTLRAHAGPSQGYLALLVAAPQGEEPPHLERRGDSELAVRGPRGAACVRLDRGARTWVVEQDTPAARGRLELRFPDEPRST